MNLTPEQIAAASKANMETLANVTHKAFEGVEKLLELNIQVAKALMQDNIDHVKSAINAKDVQQLMAIQANIMHPLAEKMASYSRHIYQIATETQATLTKTAKEDLETQAEKLKTAYKDATSSMPQGSDAMAQVIKHAVANANTLFESSQKAMKQAIDMSNNQLKSVTEQALKASEHIAKSATRK
ncbi:MAG: phasin family protein [Betaproteobacteria bacterium]|jgi:phasin family protein